MYTKVPPLVLDVVVMRPLDSDTPARVPAYEVICVKIFLMAAIIASG